MDRIQVNGVWYVKEENQSSFNTENIFYSRVCVYETNEWFIKAEFYSDDDQLENVFSGCYIEFENKITGLKDDSENENWFFGILNNDPESMEEANRIFDADGLELFKSFLNHLININWLKK